MLKALAILFPFFVLMLWLGRFLSRYKQNTRSQNIWTVVVGILAIVIGINCYYWFFDGNYGLYYVLDVVSSFATLAFVPVIFLYFREVTGDRSKWSKLKIALLFLPSALFGSIGIIYALLLGKEQTLAFIQLVFDNSGNVLPNEILYYDLFRISNPYTFSLALLAQAVYVFTYATRRLLHYRKNLNNFFSNIENKDMKHHWAVLWGILALLMLVFATSASGYMMYIEYDIWVAIFLILYGLSIYFICHHVALSNYTAESFAKETQLSEDEIEQPKQPIGEEESDNLKQLRSKVLPELERVIKDYKVFLNKDLHLDNLAHLIHSNRSYTSRLINEEYQCNFSEFINRQRIEYAKELGRSNPQLTQEQIAEMSGFAHATTFSSTFKRYTGVNFREFMKQSDE